MRVAGISSLSIAAAVLIGSATAGAAGPPRIGPVGTVTTIGGTKTPRLTAKLSTTRAGAKRVALTLQLQTALVCGQAGPTAVVVELPAAARVPARLQRMSVAVGGRPPRAIAVKGRRVTISPARTPGVMCHSVTIGTLVIHFTHAARLENPRKPGRYAVVVRRGTAHYRATITISA